MNFLTPFIVLGLAVVVVGGSFVAANLMLRGPKLTCPNCNNKYRYTDLPSKGKIANYGLCPKCKRGQYVEPGHFFNQFPIKPVNNWLIMPMCEICGVRSSVLYDANDHKMKCSEDAYSKANGEGF